MTSEQLKSMIIRKAFLRTVFVSLCFFVSTYLITATGLDFVTQLLGFIGLCFSFSRMFVGAVMYVIYLEEQKQIDS